MEYVEEILSPHFGGMMTFVRDCEVSTTLAHSCNFRAGYIFETDLILTESVPDLKAL